MDEKIKKTGIFKKADFILILIVLAVCFALLLLQAVNTDPPVAYIYVKGQEVTHINLNEVSKKQIIKLDCTPKAEITVEKGTIYYSHAECHDKLCVRRGKLTHPGETAACLPSESMIVIKGQKDKNSPDVITY